MNMQLLRPQGLGVGLMVSLLLVTACSDAAQDGSGTEAQETGGTTTEENDTETSTDGDASALPDTIEIGVLDDLTGPAAFCGVEEVEGMRLAIADAMEEDFLGGGQRIELRVEDTASTPDGAVTGYQALVDSNVPVVVGPCVSSAAAAVVQRAERDGLAINLTTAGAEDLVAPEWVYRTGLNQPQFAGLAIDVLAEEGVETTALIFNQENPAITELVDSVLSEKFEEHGIEVVGEYPITTSTEDMSSQVAEIRQNSPDAIGVLTLGAQNLTIVEQIREAGLEQTVWGQIGMYADHFFQGGDVVDGTIFAVSFAPCFSDRSIAFDEQYQEEVGDRAGFAAAHGYDAIYRVLEAIREAGSLDREAVKTALDNIGSMSALQGELTFDDQGDAEGNGGVVRLTGDGDLECLLTPSEV